MQAPGLFDIPDPRGKYGLVHNIGLGGAVVVSLLRRPEFYAPGGPDGRTRYVTFIHPWPWFGATALVWNACVHPSLGSLLYCRVMFLQVYWSILFPSPPLPLPNSIAALRFSGWVTIMHASANRWLWPMWARSNRRRLLNTFYNMLNCEGFLRYYESDANLSGLVNRIVLVDLCILLISCWIGCSGGSLLCDFSWFRNDLQNINLGWIFIE